MQIRVFIVISAATLASLTPVSAQDAAVSQFGDLRAELSLERNLYYPSQSIPLRCTLFNAADAPVDLTIPSVGDDPEEIILPRELILGTPDEPALFIAYEKESPVAIPPPALAANDVAQRTLRLAPKSALGAEIDLTPLYPLIRYSGDYRLEWRPKGLTHAAAVTFRVEARKDAVLITDYGKITFQLSYEEAPRNVENFIDLIRARFYDRMPIHRLVPGFILQAGSPDGTNRGVHPDGRFVPAEFHDAPFDLGTLAMALKPKDPNSASCQFFISLNRNPMLDGRFTVVGQAYGDESFRTLRELSNQPIDANEHPVKPLMIRNMLLIDAQDNPRTETIK